MDWILSGTSVAMLWMMGNKSIWGPVIGLVNQILWTFYAISIKQYGLLVGVVAFAVIHVRNLILWNKQRKVA